jgi:S1-C subfamily serine protease
MRALLLATAVGILTAGADPAREVAVPPKSEEPRALRPELNELRDVVFRRSVVAVASVVRSTPDGEIESTGFVIGDRGHLVTVLPPEEEHSTLAVAYGSGERSRFPSERLASDPYTGLALIAAPEMPPVTALYAAERAEVSPGDYVYTVSESGNDGPSCVVGRVAGREKLVGGETLAASVWRVHFDADAGTAGAPLMDRDARVIGVLLLGGEGGVGYALPVEHVSKLLRDHARHGAAHAAWLGLGMTMGTSTPEIRSLRDASPARAAGLRPGDVILSIGGRKVEDYQDVIDACYALTAGEGVEFHVLRGLDDFKADVTPVVRLRK